MISDDCLFCKLKVNEEFDNNSFFIFPTILHMRNLISRNVFLKLKVRNALCKHEDFKI